MDYQKTPLDQLITEGLVIQTEFSRNKKKPLVPACYARGLQAKENRAKQQQLAKERQELAEVQELTAAPSLCAKSVQLAGKRDRQDFSEYAMRWKEERDQKVTISRLEESMHSGQLPRTRSPLPAPPGYKSPVRDWRARAEHYQSTRSVTPDAATFRPAIDPVSKKLAAARTKEPQTERFRRFEEERIKKIQDERAKVDESLASSLRFTPSTNNVGIERPADVSTYLYTTGVEEMRRKQDTAAKALPDGCTFRPELNLNSAELAQRHRLKTPPPHKSATFEAPLPGAKQQLTSAQLTDFLTRNYTNPNLKAKVTQRQSADDPECTFHPSLNESSIKVAGNMYERSMEHLKSVHAKIASTRVKLTQEKYAECTFQPRVLQRSVTPPPETCGAHKHTDSYSSTLPLTDAISRKSTASTLESDAQRKVYEDARRQQYHLSQRCSDGCPAVIDDMDDLQRALSEVGIDW